MIVAPPESDCHRLPTNAYLCRVLSGARLCSTIQEIPPVGLRLQLKSRERQKALAIKLNYRSVWQPRELFGVDELKPTQPESAAIGQSYLGL